ncbi:hypothetical protein RYH80_19815, partial [Halobaculum sp. MBLA0147]|uniref:hypothetical protein n=1 Tax=Halobaculum sp. MBLA0147 TaxID=3079934 RepID=UPI003526558D
MTDETRTLDEFADATAAVDHSDESTPDRDDGSEDTPASDEEAAVTLFRLSNDPFVNAGAAALAAALSDTVSVTADRLSCSAETVSGTVADLSGLVHDALGNTHRRTSIAHSINYALEEAGRGQDDPRWVPPAGVVEDFPEEHDLTAFDDDEIDPERLAEHDVPETDSIAEFDNDQGLYVQSEEYIGNNTARQYNKQVEKLERYLEAFEAALTDAVDDDPEYYTCQCCGRADVPSYDDPLTDEKVEYNQMFAPLASSSAVLKPLGSGGRTSGHKGRCVACLVAGFYFAVMAKAVRQTASDDNDARIFTPVGDFERLVPAMADIRTLREENGLDTPAGDQNVHRRTVGALNTRVVSLQALDIYEQFLQRVNPETDGEGLLAEPVYRPTTLRTFVSTLDRTRDIGSLELIDPDDDIYDRVANAEYELEDGTVRRYWPVQDILRWFAEFGDDDTQLAAKELLGEGVIHADLERLERGVFGFTRAQFRGDGRFPSYRPHPADIQHYFTRLMTQASLDAIDTESIEAIRRVASSIGSIFHDGDDISVLIGLQNAGTQTEFLRAFEKASMQAQKASTEDAPAQYNAARDDDVETVLELISDDATFEPAKRMFVIHAALSAQYENATNTEDDE